MKSSRSIQTSRENGNAAALFAVVARRPGGSSLAAYIYSVLPNDTDLTPVLAGPYTAYNFAFIGRSGLYHSPLATPARLDQGAVQDMGAQVLELSRALLRADPLPAPAPMIPALPNGSRSMPAGWSWPTALAS